MSHRKKTGFGFVLLMLGLPVVTYAQEVTPVPVDTAVVNKTVKMAKDMIRLIQAEPDCFNSFKGDFYLTDEQGNNYYTARNLDLNTERQYVEVKKGGEVSFVANWKQKDRGDHLSMMAVTAFSTYITRLAEGKGYMAEAPVREQGSPEVRYYLKTMGGYGKRVALFIYNPISKESTFIVD